MSFQLRYDMGSFGNSIRRGHRLAVEGELGWCRGLIGAVRGLVRRYGCTSVTGIRALRAHGCYWIRATNSTLPVLSGPT